VRGLDFVRREWKVISKVVVWFVWEDLGECGVRFRIRRSNKREDQKKSIRSGSINFHIKNDGSALEVGSKQDEVDQFELKLWGVTFHHIPNHIQQNSARGEKENKTTKTNML
jgi:hypothetical protein